MKIILLNLWIRSLIKLFQGCWIYCLRMLPVCRRYEFDKAAIEEQATELRKRETRKLDILNTLKNEVRINKLHLTSAIKDDFLIYQAGQLNVLGTDLAIVETIKLGMSYNVQYFELNKSPKFEAEIPTETVTLEQLMHIFQSPSGM